MASPNTLGVDTAADEIGSSKPLRTVDGYQFDPVPAVTNQPCLSAADGSGNEIAGSQNSSGGLALLVQALAVYSADNAGFNSASAAQSPSDPALQTVLAAAIGS